MPFKHQYPAKDGRARKEARMRMALRMSGTGLNSPQ